MINKRVLCLGNITQDVLIRVNDIPPLDEVAMVNNYTDCMGGRGAIVAVSLGALGVNPTYITYVPKCTTANDFIEVLNLNGVNTKFIGVDDSSSRLFQVTAVISEVQKNCISFFNPSKINFSVTDAMRSEITNADIIYFSTHNKKFNLALMRDIDKKRTHVIHNACSYFLNSAEYVKPMLNNSHTLICNENEFALLLEVTKSNSINDIWNMTADLSMIIVTQGIKGSTVYTRNHGEKFYSTSEVEALAPIGAGDSYAAGIVYGMYKDWSIDVSVNFAHKLSGISVNSMTSYPDLNRVVKLKDTFEEVK